MREKKIAVGTHIGMRSYRDPRTQEAASSLPYVRIAVEPCVLAAAEDHFAVGRVVGHGLAVTHRGQTIIGLLGLPTA